MLVQIQSKESPAQNQKKEATRSRKAPTQGRSRGIGSREATIQTAHSKVVLKGGAHTREVIKGYRLKGGQGVPAQQQPIRATTDSDRRFHKRFSTQGGRVKGTGSRRRPFFPSLKGVS